MVRTGGNWWGAAKTGPIHSVTGACWPEAIGCGVSDSCSASPELLKQSSESLAGRVETVAMSGFSIGEVGNSLQARHWIHGGFPLSFLARTETDSSAWRKNFIHTFLERDIPSGNRNSSNSIVAFLDDAGALPWTDMECRRARAFSRRQWADCERYLDILSAVFMIRQLTPWHANLKKRQVKSPKIYFRDTGLLHQLLAFVQKRNYSAIPNVVLPGKGMLLRRRSKQQNRTKHITGQLMACRDRPCTHKEGRMLGVECKRMDAPRITPSMRIARESWTLNR